MLLEAITLIDGHEVERSESGNEQQALCQIAPKGVERPQQIPFLFVLSVHARLLARGTTLTGWIFVICVICEICVLLHLGLL